MIPSLMTQLELFGHIFSSWLIVLFKNLYWITIRTNLGHRENTFPWVHFCQVGNNVIFLNVKGCLSLVQSSGALSPFIKWLNVIVLFSSQYLTLDINNIWSFIFTPLSDKTNARTRGVMWRILMIYSFFILSGILGILNAFPRIRKVLDRKPRFGRVQSFPL